MDHSSRDREKDEVGTDTNRPDAALDSDNPAEDYGPNEKTLAEIADVEESRGPA